jgi:MFS transporter, DHA2 family, multidrug resistance protein
MTTLGSARWWALGAVCLSVLAVSLDGTVLSVALPTLARALHASESDLEWFSSGYLLLLAAAVLPVGLLGDRFGRKRILTVSLIVFGAGSALCAYASSPGMFLIARLLMGGAGAGVAVIALSQLTVLFDESERPKAVGVFQAANFLALPLGPIVGGWMLSRFWWGWMFLVNVPVVLLGVVVVAGLLPESRASRRPGLDPVGTAASMGGLVAVTYGVIEAGRNGWGDSTALGCMAAGVVMLVGFFGWERRLAARGGEPLIDPALFASRSFTWGSLLAGVVGLAMIGLLFTMPQYFQAVRGADAFGSGLRLLPLVGGLLVGSLPASVLAKAVGAKITVATGFVLVAIGSAVGGATTAASSTWFVSTWMAVVCAGTGMAMAAAVSVAISQLSAERSATGSAVVQVFQKTAGPFGTAIMGSVLAAGYQSHLDASGLAPAVAAAARHSVYSGLAVAQNLDSAPLADVVRAAFVHGMDASLLVSAAIAVVGAVLTVAFLPGARRNVHIGKHRAGNRSEVAYAAYR